MPTRLDRLVYRSVAVMPTEALAPLAELLGEAQRNNARDGLTGALAAHDGRFLQVVEGDSGYLDQLQRRLGRDRRHREIEVLDRRPIERRAFDAWTMASARITPSLAPELDALMTEATPSGDRIVGLMLEAVAPT
ncbi:hypothetical protein GCM10009116_04870 [Brevundimonas basaltis]|uniref:BLUF domain-containing protein n=1 Tax=Brevundimonas basaltis TaxID=472166 RepID=A0A7W8MI90_9CAUL|nr:BLUF domain-containing protein [Brevundimonas basaltis]MBB5292756.1 hypothetical protein [Brevundimonas basaltis]